MGDGLSPILSSGTVQPGRQLPEVVMEMKLEGIGKLLLEECLGNRDATITMTVNAPTIVQGTMQLEVPLLEDEGKKGEYATARTLAADFRPGRMPSQAPAHRDASPTNPVTYNRRPLSRAHTGGLLLSTKFTSDS